MKQSAILQTALQHAHYKAVIKIRKLTQLLQIEVSINCKLKYSADTKIEGMSLLAAEG